MFGRTFVPFMHLLFLRVPHQVICGGVVVEAAAADRWQAVGSTASASTRSSRAQGAQKESSPGEGGRPAWPCEHGGWVF